MGRTFNWKGFKRNELIRRHDSNFIEKVKIEQIMKSEKRLESEINGREYLRQLLNELRNKEADFPCDSFLLEFVQQKRTMTLKQEKYLLDKLNEYEIAFDSSKLNIKIKPSKPTIIKQENVRSEQKYVYGLLMELSGKNSNFPAKDFMKQFIHLRRTEQKAHGFSRGMNANIAVIGR